MIAALRAQLERVKVEQPPYLCLLHEETSRTHVQAHALGATQILHADAAKGELMVVLSRMIGVAAPVLNELTPSIAAAEMALSRIFEAARGGAVDPGLVATGTKFVAQAVRTTGIRDWLEVVWRFDDVTHQHCLLVAGLASGFAQSLGLSQADCQRLTQAALLHDIGKAKIPEAILNKPGALDPEERRIMQQHPSLGHAMLRGSGFSDEMLAVVRSHHECLDGSGYPDGLRGAEIADLVRLVSVCDVYGALIERRPYKTPLSAERAYSILEGMSGKLDGDLVRAFRPFAVFAAPHPKHL
ncbi:HD-GYP domain-containing protein [Methylobacterium iners]